MNGYMWFHAGRALAAKANAGSQPVRRQHERGRRTSRHEAALAVLFLLATLVITYAAMTG